MRRSIRDLLGDARKSGYAVGAFNIYNLEGATAVVRAAEELRSPVIIQLLPKALEIGGRPLVSMCCAMAEQASVAVAVHLDHCPSQKVIENAVHYGIGSVMADGSDLTFEENIHFTEEVVRLVKNSSADGAVEAELGKMSGMEDGEVVEAHLEKMTNPDQAVEFVSRTGVDALAVCIGNVHGRYTTPPHLDFERLAEIGAKVDVPLVLHGTSGLPDEMIVEAISFGVSKFNVNTEVRTVYLDTMRQVLCQDDSGELAGLMKMSIEAMKFQVRQKIRLFGSSGKSLSM